MINTIKGFIQEIIIPGFLSEIIIPAFLGTVIIISVAIFLTSLFA